MKLNPSVVMRRSVGVLLLSLMGLSAGCGQKGPLTLPASAAASAPASAASR